MAPTKRGVYPEGTIHRGADGRSCARPIKTSVAKVAKQHGISEQTLYVWRKRYGKLEAADVKELRALQQENGRLKKLLAERDLAIEVMKEINAKKW